MSLNGSAHPGQKLVGRVNAISLLTISAYGVAVKNGFKGTEEEWLKSLEMAPEQVEEAVSKYLEENPVAIDDTLTIAGRAADAKATGDAIRKVTAEAVNGHIANKENPHSVNKEQVGLGNVDNTSDMEKPVSNAQAEAIAEARNVGVVAHTNANNAIAAANDAKTYAIGYTNEQVKKAAPWNMLVNSDFRNPFNQQGLKTYEGSGYGIDRWAASGSSCSVTVSNGYVVFSSTSDSNQTVRQFIPDEINLYGKTVTLACETTSGTVYFATGVVPDSKPTSSVYRCVCNIGSAQVRLCISATTHNAVQIYTPNYTVRLRWIALYEGEYTADTLPAYQPKDHAVEMAECYRHCLMLLKNNEYYTFFNMVAGWGAILKIEAPFEMRVTPDLKTFDGTKPSIYHPDSGWVQASVSFSRKVGTTYYYAITIPSGYTFEDGKEYPIRNIKCLDANLN